MKKLGKIQLKNAYEANAELRSIIRRLEHAAILCPKSIETHDDIIKLLKAARDVEASLGTYISFTRGNQ